MRLLVPSMLIAVVDASVVKLNHPSRYDVPEHGAGASVVLLVKVCETLYAVVEQVAPTVNKGAAEQASDCAVILTDIKNKNRQNST